MASWQIEWKPAALRELRKLPSEAARRIVAAVEALQEQPFPPGARKLAGATASWRIREGDFRIVYTVLSERLVVEIVKVGHRKDIYR